MATFKKMVAVTDAVLDCIPIVSTISNAAEALYKLAHKVDTVNPVAPGLKTSIKIHVLRKSFRDCFVGAIPIMGNLIRFVEHVLSLFKKNNESAVLQAIKQNNQLKDNENADQALRNAADYSSHQIFTQILTSRKWEVSNLVGCLFYIIPHDFKIMTVCQVKNSHTLLDLLSLETTENVFDRWETHHFFSNAEKLLQINEDELARRLLKIAFLKPQDFLNSLQFEFQAQQKLDLGIVALQVLSEQPDSQCEKLGIEKWSFIDSVLEQYGAKIPIHHKIAILTNLFPSKQLLEQGAKRSALFTKYVVKWKEDLRLGAHQLCQAVYKKVDATHRPHVLLFCAFQRILHEHFPGCASGRSSQQSRPA